MNPCTRLAGDSSSRRIAGGTRTWETSMEKLRRPSRLACKTAMALAGAVVSETDSEEDHAALRVGARDFDGFMGE